MTSVFNAILLVIPEANDGGFNSTEFNYYLRTRLIDIFGAQMTSEQYEQVYNAMRWFYVNHPYIDDLDANREAFNQVKASFLSSFKYSLAV